MMTARGGGRLEGEARGRATARGLHSVTDADPGEGGASVCNASHCRISS